MLSMLVRQQLLVANPGQTADERGAFDARAVWRQAAHPRL